MDEIRATLEAINRAWREQTFAAMEPLLDENIVMKGPGLKEFARGRQSFVQSYAQFMEQSKVLEYAESDHSVHNWGDVAAASYDWAMTYEQKGQTKTERGQDMFVFHRTRTGWVAVLRIILF